MEKILFLGVSLVVLFFSILPDVSSIAIIPAILSILSNPFSTVVQPLNPTKQTLLDEAWSAFKTKFSK